MPGDKDEEVGSEPQSTPQPTPSIVAPPHSASTPRPSAMPTSSCTPSLSRAPCELCVSLLLFFFLYLSDITSF
ncbi:uncharacterized protein A4U43_C06F18390 [Asparagus officinalis]|uniref:Uncharacterized protein n=1 Tax=Asparagus officinalis TaxID=4686 RepID=A0A5P1ER39_ASPOF|nr:uncharacterized protein A4U43_C06F18390 [Asparagus officinalis]